MLPEALECGAAQPCSFGGMGKGAISKGLPPAAMCRRQALWGGRRYHGRWYVRLKLKFAFFRQFQAVKVEVTIHFSKAIFAVVAPYIANR